MSRPPKSGLSGNSKPIPIKLDPALAERIEKIAEKIGEPKSTVMRMCMRIGLDQLEKVYEARPSSYGAGTPGNAFVLNDEEHQQNQQKKKSA